MADFSYLEEKRCQLELSVSQLCQQAGISEEYYGHLLEGKIANPQAQKLQALYKALQIVVGY